MNGANQVALATVLAIVGLATVALLVSHSANTGNVLTSIGQSLSNVINAATSPVGQG